MWKEFFRGMYYLAIIIIMIIAGSWVACAVARYLKNN